VRHETLRHKTSEEKEIETLGAGFYSTKVEKVIYNWTIDYLRLKKVKGEYPNHKKQKFVICFLYSMKYTDNQRVIKHVIGRVLFPLSWNVIQSFRVASIEYQAISKSTKFINH